MASCSDVDEASQKNKENAQKLRSVIFRNELMFICYSAFKAFNAQKHSPEFLHDVIAFTHTYLEHLEEYSKGKRLTIRTGQRRKVKRQQAKRRGGAQSENEDEDGDGDFDPNNPTQGGEENDGHIEEHTFYDAEFGEDSDEEVNVERQFNFNQEFSLLVSYDVVS